MRALLSLLGNGECSRCTVLNNEQETQLEPGELMVPCWGRGGPRMDTARMCSVFIPAEQKRGDVSAAVCFDSAERGLLGSCLVGAMGLSSLSLSSGQIAHIYAFYHSCKFQQCAPLARSGPSPAESLYHHCLPLPCYESLPNTLLVH